MINIFKHLLPTGRAWSLTATKNLRKFFEAIAPETSDNPRTFAGDLYGDIFPQTTRQLREWERQFGLPRSPSLTVQQRRDRLEAKWRDRGGQSPKYIQDTLRANGFDVYVHEWWEPGTEPPIGFNSPPATPRNPLSVINSEYSAVVPMVDCGEPLAECGEVFAEAGNFLGRFGYPLVNKFIYDSDDVGYTVPNDPSKWPFFMYIGGPEFGDVAEIPAARRYEFEELILRIRPTQLWIGVIVRYV